MEDLKHNLASRLWSTLEVHLIELIFHQTGPVSMAPSFHKRRIKKGIKQNEIPWDSTEGVEPQWKMHVPRYLEEFPAVHLKEKFSHVPNCICRSATAWIIWWIGVMWSGAGEMSSVLLIDFSLLPWHFFANHRGVGRVCIRGGHVSVGREALVDVFFVVECHNFLIFFWRGEISSKKAGNARK